MIFIKGQKELINDFRLTYFCINVDSSLVDKQIQFILFMDYDLQFVYKLYDVAFELD